MTRYLRRVFLVPVWLVVTFIILYTIIDLSLPFTLQPFDLPKDHPALVPLWEGRLEAMRIAVFAAAALYAIVRVATTHPAANSRHHQWLATTPWTYRKPLPLGPVHLVWQDALVVGILMLLAWWRVEMDPLFIAVAFGGGYVLVMFLMLGAGNAGDWAFLILLLSPIVGAMGVHAPWMLTAIVCLIVLSYWGQRKSFQRFPWIESTTVPIGDLGWPFARLSPLELLTRNTFGPGVVVGMVLGWGAGWIMWFLPIGQEHLALRDMILWSCLLGILGVLIRLVTYLNGYGPPTSLRGRIATGQWIIWRFDQVFIGPIAILITGAVVPLIADRLALPIWAFSALLVASICAVTAEVGPSLSRWRLTGAHRIVPGLSSQSHTRL